MDVLSILKIIEIVLSVLLVVVIVMQPKDADAGSLFGGGFSDDVKRTKRGAELFLHNATIVIAAAWVGIAIAIMFLGS